MMNLEKLEYYTQPENITGAMVTLMSDFEYYMKFMFFAVNESEMIFKPFHRTIIQALESLVFQTNKKRNLAICLPVGSGKSLIVEYFITWCFARNINNAFLYTSHSSVLINKLSKESKDIVEHPVWTALFGQHLKKDERSKVNWGFEGSKNRTGLTAGTVGGAITGLDAGNPNIEGFSGALIIDDPVDAGEINHPLTRENCVKFYDDKLSTRRRTSNTPTILISQRLHKEDLAGHLLATELENWEFVIIPAVDEQGNSFWPERYSIEEMTKIQNTNPYKFLAQYQQNPPVAGGTVIKGEWFGYYENLKDVKFVRLFMTADTAQKTKEHNDYTVFCVWGITTSHLYLIDMVRGKWEAPELLIEAKNLWNKYKKGINNKLFSMMYVEDKASGTGLIQTLKRKSKVPVKPIQRNVDKLIRVEDNLDTIYAGQVLLPISKTYKFNVPLIAECESFARDGTHKHDDIVDNICDACDIFKTGYSREELVHGTRQAA